MTVKGSPPVGRYFVAGDESDLTILNLTDPTLPRAVKGVLRDVASHHPEYVSAAQQGRTRALQEQIVLAPDGVFVAPVERLPTWDRSSKTSREPMWARSAY